MARLYIYDMEESKQDSVYEKSINSAIPIWEILKISKEEYMEKYAQPFTIEEAKVENQNRSQ